MNWKLDLPFNWFDVFVVLMLVIGYTRGRKNGMSQESIPFFKWIALILVCAITYEPLGMLMVDNFHLSRLLSFFLAYIAVALVVTMVFAMVSRSLGEKIKGTDKFGKAEFYLAMPAGIMRFACITMLLLALLNARYYTTEEVRATQKYNDYNYGSDFFPSLYSIQDDVFKDSLIGKQVHEHLSFLLIKPTQAGAAQPVTAFKQKDFTW